MGSHRVNVINTLQLIASYKEQLEYQRKVPWINVATELVNQWFCDFYHPDFPQFEAEFSQEELVSLAGFNTLYDLCVSVLPNSIAELHKSAAWAKVAASAGEVLRVNGWEGVNAQYGS